MKIVHHILTSVKHPQKLRLFPLSSMPSLSQPGPLGAPPPTGQWDDLLQIKVFLQAHARQKQLEKAVESE
jgi:hypothetical protein